VSRQISFLRNMWDIRFPMVKVKRGSEKVRANPHSVSQQIVDWLNSDYLTVSNLMKPTLHQWRVEVCFTFTAGWGEVVHQEAKEIVELQEEKIHVVKCLISKLSNQSTGKNDILDVGATKVIVINPRWTMDAKYLSHPSCKDYYFSIKFIYFSLWTTNVSLMVVLEGLEITQLVRCILLGPCMSVLKCNGSTSNI